MIQTPFDRTSVNRIADGSRLGILRRRLGIVPAVAGLNPMEMILMPDLPTDISTTNAATARVQTTSASRYLQQLCKHMAHHLDVAFTPEHGTIRFPAEGRAGSFPGEALVTFDAEPEALAIHIEASAPAQTEAMKGVVARHLDRFAFREAPLALDWQ